MLFGVLIVTPDTLLVKLVTCSAPTLLFWRQLFSGLAIGVAAVFLEGSGRLVHSVRTYWRETLVNTLIWCISTASFALGAAHAPAATVLVILAAQSLVAAAFGRVLLHERLPLPTLAAIVVGFAAVIIVFAWDVTGATALGYCLAALCALFLPLYMVLVRRLAHRHPEATMLPCLILGPAGILPFFALALGAKPLSPTPLDFLWLCLQGLVVCPVTFIALTLGPRAIPAAEVSLMLLLETALGPVWVWLALGEAPPHGSAIGGSLLLATLIAHSAWVLHRERKRRASKRASAMLASTTAVAVVVRESRERGDMGGGESESKGERKSEEEYRDQREVEGESEREGFVILPMQLVGNAQAEHHIANKQVVESIAGLSDESSLCEEETLTNPVIDSNNSNCFVDDDDDQAALLQNDVTAQSVAVVSGASARNESES